jgi:GTP:adenosylcobinamide-phosphate guanylyltransferase
MNKTNLFILIIIFITISILFLFCLIVSNKQIKNTETFLTQEITSIITTAPQKSIPSPHIILETIRSLSLGSLDNSRVIIGFDGNKVRDHNLHPKCTTEFSEELYNEYKNNVKREARAILKNVDFVEMPERSCLTNLLKECMSKVTTKFVCVIQQDLPFIKSFNLNTIISLMNTNSKVKMVRLAFGTNEYHEKWTKGYCGSSLESEKISFMGDTFTTCSQMSDQTHITTVSFYNDNIWPNVKPFDFMEHQIICNPVINNDRSVWYLGDMNDAYTGNTDGRNSD